MRHVISALVQNKPGVLAHVAGMFSARGYNIDSLIVGRTEDPKLSRMTIVVIGADRIVEQVRKQLSKLVPVVKVQDLTGSAHVERDLLLARVESPASKRAEIAELARLFRAKVIDVSAESMLIELSGNESKIEGFIDLLRPYGIRELSRTGTIAMLRGDQKKPTAEEA